MSQTYAKPLPRIDDKNRPFWQATEAGRLTVQRCGACGALRYPFAEICAECLSSEADWVEVSGRGTVWSFCTFHRNYFKGFEAEIPYSVVLVRLDEGPRLYSNLVGVPREQIRIGMRVKASFEHVADGVSLVKFKPEV